MQSKQKLNLILGIVAIALLIAGVWFVTYLDSRMGRRDDLEEEKASAYHKSVSFYLYNEDEDPIYQTTDRVKFYLIAGTDASGNEFATDDKYEGGMADFLLLIGVNDTQKTFGYLEINRDTITDVPMMDESGQAFASADMQICIAHAYGANKFKSAENTVDTVSAFLKGTPIDGYFIMNMDDIGKVNHLLGGVEVTMDEDYTDIDKTFEKGATLTLTDEQTVALVRSRMTVQDGSNENRMARQTLYMNAMLGKVGTLLTEDKEFLTTLFEGLEEFSTTDLNRAKMGKIGSKAASYTSLGMITMEGESQINVSFIDNKEHAEFYVSEEEVINTLSKFYKLEKYEDEEFDDAQFEEKDEDFSEDETAEDDTEDDLEDNNIEETDDADEDMEE